MEKDTKVEVFIWCEKVKCEMERKTERVPKRGTGRETVWEAQNNNKANGNSGGREARIGGYVSVEERGGSVE